MENYDLLFKYQTNFVGCADHSCEEDQILDDDHTIDDEGGTTLPDGNGDSDSVTIDGKDPYELTDEDIEEGIKAQDANKNGGSLINSFAKDTLDKLKQLILWFLDPNKKPEVKPVEPEPDPNTGGGDVNPDDGTDGTGSDDIEPIDQNLTLSRGQAQKTVKLTSEEKVLTLTNPFGGENYQYTISARDGKSVTAKFEFLDNGRLVVTGDNIEIVAGKNQKDDIILMGNNCDVDTNDADDIVRVGYAIDSDVFSMDNYHDIYTREDEKKIKHYQYITYGNTINTGTGNDYVAASCTDSTIDTGEGTDKVLHNIYRPNVENAEFVYYTQGITENIDGKNGWAMQGEIPDCRLFALINGLCRNDDNGSISNFVTINQSGDDYEVIFKKYPGANKKATIKKSELTNFKDVFGDRDTVLIDIALNKLIKENIDNDQRVEWIDEVSGKDKSYDADKSVETAFYNTISKYLTGSEEITAIGSNWGNIMHKVGINNYNYRDEFLRLWDAYEKGTATNFQIGINEDDNKLGIISGHAYSVRKVDTINNYIEIINPWDDADCLRLSLDKFFRLNTDVIIYGVNLTSYLKTIYMPNGGDAWIEAASANNNTLAVEMAIQKVKTEVPIVEEIKEIEENIEQVKALLSLTRPKTVEEV